MSNGATITTLSNSGSIIGGKGGGATYPGGSGGAGVLNEGMIELLANSGAISGGIGGLITDAGGAGVMNAGTIATLTNRGTITGGNAGLALGVISVGGAGGAGGAGVSNAGTITSLTNRRKISGGNGGDALGTTGVGGAGGAGVSNSGTIAALVNSGVIQGGQGGTGPKGDGAAGDAIFSAGANASIGPITNSGQIIGSVEIDNQANVTIRGGTGKTYGSWTGGLITIGNGNLIFLGGNTALGDDVSVNGGAGTVVNAGALRLAAPVSIAGNFIQTASGVLDSVIAGDAQGDYGSLAVTLLATLDGRLALDLTGGFTLSAGDVFDLMTFAGVGGDFSHFSLDGVACSAHSTDVWRCSDLSGLYLEEVFGTGSLSLDVVSAAATGAASPIDLLTPADPPSAAVPEPPTWAMLGLGFLGLGLLGRRRYGRPLAT